MTALYVHLPFCLKKCHYCDFVSYPASFAEREAYLSLLEREMALRRGIAPPATVYFGGGTPSLLAIPQWQRLLAAVDRHFGLAAAAEISLEANPGTIDAAYCRQLRALGFNRISIGAQAFQDSHLAALGRSHDRGAILQAVEAAATAFDNIGIDLMYGLPGQTMADWRESLACAVALPLRHISTYGLKLGLGSNWGRREDRLPLPSADDNAAMQTEALTFLAAAGYPHYEIANFAPKGYACRHNLAYWLGDEYLGLGLAASSYLGGLRLRNHGDLPSYRAALSRGEASVAERECLSAEERRLEEIFLRLRLAEGLSLAAMKEKYGLDFLVEKKGQMVKLLQADLITVEKGQLKLTIKGIPVQNEILLYLI